MKFARELYPRIALLKAAYSFTDRAYIHLDSDEHYYIVTIHEKPNCAPIMEDEFVNEMLIQSVRHEVYCRTKNVRELLLARAMATSLIIRDDVEPLEDQEPYTENEILQDWFNAHENNET